MKRKTENDMTEVIDTKPEPISAKPNWHYDSYFLAQLERLNLRKPIEPQPQPKRRHSAPKTEKPQSEPTEEQSAEE